jgi:hypothetical protein
LIWQLRSDPGYFVTLFSFQDAEIAKLTAMLQKTEMKSKSLERTVDQKNRENEV